MIVNRFGPGEAALIEIVKITEANPNAKPLDQALAELDLADWYLMFDKPSRATPVYVHARQLMRDKAALSNDEIEAYFKPTALYRPIPDNPPAPPPQLRTNPTEGHVEVSFTVTEAGDVAEMKTLSSEPEGLMDIKVRRGMRAARFRPRFEGDTPVIATNQIYRHTFVYYPHTEGVPSEGAKQTSPKQDSAKQNESNAESAKDSKPASTPTAAG
jgi:TonB family protein